MENNWEATPCIINNKTAWGTMRHNERVRENEREGESMRNHVDKERTRRRKRVGIARSGVDPCGRGLG